MLDTLKGIISDLHVFLYGGFRSLPLTLSGTMLILGLFTANYALLFFVIGFLILSPLGATIINRVIPLFYNAIYYMILLVTLDGKDEVAKTKEIDRLVKWTDIPYFSKKSTDVCNLVIPYLTSDSPANKENETIISSHWMAMMAFFIGYVIHNGIQLYTVDTSPDMAVITNSKAVDINTKVKARKTQAMVSIITTIIFALVVIGLRLYSGCETEIGLLLTATGFGAMGYFWYEFLSSLGQDRLSDIFGIANRILPPSAVKNGPIACIPIPSV